LAKVNPPAYFFFITFCHFSCRAPTGSVKDLYLALAKVANLQLVTPEQQMVAARLTQRYSYGLTVFEDPKARISELLGRDANDGALLVYYYKQPELGPAGEGNHKVGVGCHNSALCCYRPLELQ
jgi:hypothetical protein